jgi:hypothetical protein
MMMWNGTMLWKRLCSHDIAELSSANARSLAVLVDRNDGMATKVTIKQTIVYRVSQYESKPVNFRT